MQTSKGLKSAGDLDAPAGPAPRKTPVTNIASVLFTVLSLGASTIVSVWLLGSLVASLVEATGPIGRQVLAEITAPPWVGHRQVEPRHVESHPSQPAAAPVGSATKWSR